MDPSKFRRSGRVRAMLWAAAILFILNFYMFVAARPAPIYVETIVQPVVESEVPPRHCDRAPRTEPSTVEISRTRDAQRILARERERLRKRCIRFADPRVSALVSSPSKG